ncbi:hypothetical protein [Ancylobacter sp. SL191]|uniref:hypothetical protein n=1 Tax=Ancylobacter sp. SL191 TaxID=2995166 RepID=UPI00226E8956|nr:hypothetical protein [Ancylobacter sp. SL191]WAC26430.1 hypothetical protein OU996_15595 [Ancylobacter sp. SL191]
MTSETPAPKKLTTPELEAWTAFSKIARDIGGSDAGHEAWCISPMPEINATRGHGFEKSTATAKEIKAGLATVRKALKAGGRDAALAAWKDSGLPRLKNLPDPGGEP